MLNNDKARSTLFGVAAAYLLYLCYGLFRDRHDANTTMAPGIRWLFLILFAAAAVWLGLYALRLWKQSESVPFGEEESEEDLPAEDSGEASEGEPEQADRS